MRWLSAGIGCAAPAEGELRPLRFGTGNRSGCGFGFATEHKDNTSGGGKIVQVFVCDLRKAFFNLNLTAAVT